MEQLIQTIMDSARIIDRPNWAEIVACIGAVIAAGASIAAIIVAANVAKKQNDIAKEQVHIADAQNRIALFEKRYAYYEVLVKCKSFKVFVSRFTENESSRSIQLFFIAVFRDVGNSQYFEDMEQIPENYVKKGFQLVYQLWNDVYTILQMGEYLFDIPNINALTEELCSSLFHLVEIRESDIDNDELPTRIAKYVNSVQNVEATLMSRIKEYLKLTSPKDELANKR